MQIITSFANFTHVYRFFYFDIRFNSIFDTVFVLKNIYLTTIGKQFTTIRPSCDTVFGFAFKFHAK